MTGTSRVVLSLQGLKLRRCVALCLILWIVVCVLIVLQVTTEEAAAAAAAPPVAAEVAEYPPYYVPNIVHYVWLGEHLTFRFHHMLSIKSAHLFIKPQTVYFHCDHEPSGEWWEHAQSVVPNIKVVHIKSIDQIYGRKIVTTAHKSDVIRLEVLLEYGGIYLDNDVIALTSFEQLRGYSMTLGLAFNAKVGRLHNSVIVTSKSSGFLRLWHASYHSFKTLEGAYHSCVVPYKLHKAHPHLIHVESSRLSFPKAEDLQSLYKRNVSFGDNYVLHLLDSTPPSGIDTNSTFAHIARLIHGSMPVT